MKANNLRKLIFVSLLALSSFGVSAATGPGGNKVTSADYSSVPPSVIEGADPLLMIDLSVELTQQAEAYTDGDVSYGSNNCPDRLSGRGICYFSNFDYIGYFDAKKCYIYDTSGANTARDQVAQSPYTDATGNAVATKPNPYYFRPSSLANADHTCNGANEWSGNYMNWATMSAIDEFRYAMTGGARLIDTIGASAQTLLIDNKDVSWSFVDKRIGTGSNIQTKSSQTFNNDPRQLTPFNVTGLTAKNPNGLGHRTRFEDNSGNALTYNGVSEFNIIVEVCNPAVSLEENCVTYSDGTNTWHKPEGLLQNNALRMRFGLSSYLADNSHTRNGGVLRSLAKYIGYLKPASSGGLEINSRTEVDEFGRTVFNPESVSITAGVNNSGVLNYINNFGLGANGYKSFDPIAELYYESLRYLKNLGPTPEYSNNITNNNMKDNFPVITNWDDPIDNECQANYKLYVGDQFAWEDHNLPGMSSGVYNGPASSNRGSPVLPSNPDTDYSTVTITNTVGSLEGFHSDLGTRTRGRNNNGWWIAGLAHYARINDIRSDIPNDQTVKTFMIDTAEYNSNPPSGEDNPMWLAAKYGGFEDYNEDDDPNNGAGNSVSNNEWDADSDGIPDTFTVANNPEKLVEGLTEAFVEVSQTTSSSSAASVVANDAGGNGAVYQAVYKPRLVSANGDQVVDWTGRVVGLLIDDQGRLREDLCDTSSAPSSSNCNKALDSSDPIIRFEFDSALNRKVANRYSPSTGNLLKGNVGFDNLQFIWDASTVLSTMTDNEVKNQRAYNSLADTGRYIFTWIDAPSLSNPKGDGIVASTEMIDFIPSSFPSLNPSDTGGAIEPRRYLGFESSTQLDADGNDLSDALVNFIRGEDQNLSGWRSRKIDVNSDGNEVTLRLSDIINSSPAVVGRPNSGYDFLYNDPTYAFYITRHIDRRQMVYVGANDGMVHAFNGGFFDAAGKAFKTQLNGETKHPLGAEMWAYVPQSLLPHLQWLSDLEYPHVYYVDGDAQTFDVNIFNDCGVATSCKYPYGWGTILVVTMRFGGADITIDPNSDSNDGDTSDDITMRSSVMIFDVTNPESAPILLAEISHEEMGFTTSKPTLYKERPRDSSGNYGSNQKWYLAFGSGPAGTDAVSKKLALKDAVSNQNAKIFVIDLNNGQPELLDLDASSPGHQPALVLNELNGFTGDFSTADWNNDFIDDAVYFGTVAGTVAAPTGHLWRWASGGSPEIMLGNSSLPITAAPRVLEDRAGRPWIFAGTGRFFVSDDILTNSQQGDLYGIKEQFTVDHSGNFSFSQVDKRSLVDTTDILVFESGRVTTPGFMQPVPVRSPDGSSVNKTAYTAAEVQTHVSGGNGWFLTLGYGFENSSWTKAFNGARNLLKADLLRNILLFDEYTPSGDLCKPAGSSRLFNLNMLSGIPDPRVIFKSEAGVDSSNPTDPYLPNALNLGTGQVAGITSSPQTDTVIVTTGGGDGDEVGNPTFLPTIAADPFGRRSWREIPLNGPQ